MMGLEFKHPETLTQAYHAGVLISMIENQLPKIPLPPMGVCIANIQSLRELLGERIWQKLKSKTDFAERIAIYEALTYQPFLPIEMCGSGREFCLGYVTSYKYSKRKTRADKRIQTVEPRIKAHLHSRIGALIEI